MKTFVTTFMLLLCVSLLGQSTDQNYRHQTIYLQPYNNGSEDNATNPEKIGNILYVDGLGRVKQTVSERAGGQGQDIVSFTAYDGFDRVSKAYLPLPFTANDGLFHPGDLSTTANSFYASKYPDDTFSDGSVNAYSETRFEDTYGGRPIEQGAPGASWALSSSIPSLNHSVRYGYGANQDGEVVNGTYRSGDNVMEFDVTFTNGNTNRPELHFEGFYDQQQLTKQTIKDENWKSGDDDDHTTITFTNKRGQVVLKRTFDNDQTHDTYYVYDSYGNLTYVLPPKASDQIKADYVIDEFYQYIDHFKFSTTKQLPGPNATGGMAFSLIDNTVTVAFDLVMDPAQQLRNGVYGVVTNLPNMTIGTFTPSGGGSYTVSIQDGLLYLNGSGSVDTLQHTLTADVSPPAISGTVLKELCYEYHYDYRNRLVEKKIPAKNWEFIVYDKLDRPILTQDGNLKQDFKWLFTKYDALGRVVYTGTFSYTTSCSSSSTSSKQSSAKWGGGSSSSSKTVFTTPNCQRIALQAIVDGQSTLNESRRTSNTIGGGVAYYTNDAYPQKQSGTAYRYLLR